MSRSSLVGLFALVVAATSTARGDDDRGDVHAGMRVFVQPASGDQLVVITPSADAHVNALRWLAFDANWTADIVTGATPRVYASPDVITAATSFSETRNSLGAGASATFGPATISAGYAWGSEHDYHSNLVRFGVRLDLLQHNTIIDGRYSHSFDSVCDLNQPNVPVTERHALFSPTLCFGGSPLLTSESVAIDNAELSITQTLTPKLVGTLSGTYQHVSGFQSNPYRSVRLEDGFVAVQESHPSLRDRGAATARLRYAIARWSATLGGDLRLYRDSWGVQSLTAEVNWDQPFRRRSRWRFGARTRGYVQSAAFFYRDAGNADSYERTGPVGSYFTADQELAPLADLLIGASFVYGAQKRGDRRIWRIFEDAELRLALDYVKAFALSPDPPNIERINSWATALDLGLSATGRF